MTAEERANELMSMKMNTLPYFAFEYLRYFCSKYGACGETYITAYAHYAQAVENLESTDRAYTIDEIGKEWFKERNI